MIGENLRKASEWMDKALAQEEKNNISLRDKCLDKAVEYEQKGIQVGESWD